MSRIHHIIKIVLGVIAGLTILTFFLGSINQSTVADSAVQNATNKTIALTGGILNLSGGAGLAIGVLLLVVSIMYFMKFIKRR